LERWAFWELASDVFWSLDMMHLNDLEVI
jgi:hypothetical protein